MGSKLKPKVSVIVPLYNSEKYIERCLDSIINQSLKNVEIIVCDDLSTDSSKKIVLEYVGIHSNIHLYSLNEKGGSGGARNLGLKYSQGHYISFVDSDDWIDSYMLERMVDLLDKHNGEVALCGILTEFNNSRLSTIRYEYLSENIIDGKFAIELLSRRLNQDISISPIVGNKVYKSDFLKKKGIHFLENSLNEDDIFSFICFLNAEKVVVTPDTYYHYYQRYDSSTHSFSKKHIEDLVEGFRILKSYLIENGIYDQYREIYYSFFEKCLSFVVSNLINLEPNYCVQNEYLKYLISISKDYISINEYIEYVGAMRLKDFLTPYKIK